LSKSPYQFSTDYFSANIGVWNEYLEEFKGRPNIHYLEVGVFEGGSLLWVAEEIFNHSSARLTAVDAFESENTHKVFLKNLKISGVETRVEVFTGISHSILRKLEQNNFDVIYIDASHMSRDVFLDTAFAWYLLKANGLMIFDDYRWRQGEFPNELRPQLAIDTFTAAFGDQIDVLYKSYQVILRKLSGPGERRYVSCIGQFKYHWRKEQDNFQNSKNGNSYSLDTLEVKVLREYFLSREIGSKVIDLEKFKGKEELALLINKFQINMGR